MERATAEDDDGDDDDSGGDDGDDVLMMVVPLLQLIMMMAATMRKIAQSAHCHVEVFFVLCHQTVLFGIFLPPGVQDFHLMLFTLSHDRPLSALAVFYMKFP